MFQKHNLFIFLLDSYRILHTLEFDSTRKRMSIILEKEDTNQIVMFCKGAESHVVDRCINGQSQATLDHIDGYAEVSTVSLIHSIIYF